VPQPAELPNRAVARRSVVASRAIKAGERFTGDNLTLKRPGTGIPADRWDDVIGRAATRDYSGDELIES
jgi:sialic acid synthase SpsE